MSLVQAVYSQLLSQLKTWHSLTQPSRLHLLRNCYFILGRPFLQALTQLESTPDSILIQQHSQYITIQNKSKRKKQLIFHKKSNEPLGLECTCQGVWQRKIGERAGFVCKHQAMYLLWRYCFDIDRGKCKPRGGDSADLLMDVLDMIRM